jgi:hypothetical protein
MTDLLAAGGGLSLALQIPDVVEQAGAIAGFASVIGLAILSALYISQARDVRRLREWAGRAPERAAEMGASGQQAQAPVPGRVVAQPQRPPGAVKPVPGAAAPAPGTPAPGVTAPAQANGDAAPAVAKEGEKPAGVGAEKDSEAAEAAAGADGQKAEEADSTTPATDKPESDKAGEAASEQPPAPAKPGMPAPASAAAAAASTPAAAAGAGAAAAAASAPAAPASKPPAPGAPAGGSPAPGTPAPGAPAGGPPKSGPVAQPQRPPGSVLPPRTGTMPTVRRLPTATAAGGRPGSPATSVLGPSGQQPPKKRNPLYIALAVIGVLLVGAAAAVGVPALVDGADDDPAKPTETTAAKKKKAAPVKPDAITVAVLNGTTIPGLAAQVGDQVDQEGFTLGTVSNASQTQGQRANSVAMYARGHQRDARSVARRLRIQNVQPVDADSQAIAGDASVVVIVGSDKTQ